jgi:hypothetical protein
MTKNPPSKKLQAFAKSYSLSWDELDKIIAQCEPQELDTLNQGDPKEIRKVINKYHS